MRRDYNRIYRMFVKKDVDGLAKVFRNEFDDIVRGYARTALTNLGWQPTDPVDQMRLFIASYSKETILRYGNNAAPFLVTLLSDKIPDYREDAAQMLDIMNGLPVQNRRKLHTVS